jgi:hypothetical protein
VKIKIFSPVVVVSVVFAVVFTGCPTPDVGVKNQTPTAADYDINGTGTFTYDGNAKTVTVTPKPGNSAGKVTVKYDGSTIAPSEVGFYTVTFDVAEASGWNAAYGLGAGTITINGADPNNQTPAAGDYEINGTGEFIYDGKIKTVTVTPKTGKSTGGVIVKYNGDAAAPSAPGHYTVTFDVTEASGWNAAGGLDAGTLAIYYVIDGVSDLSAFLSGRAANTKTNPYYIALNIENENDFTNLSAALNGAADRYVYLNLSGSNITNIPENAFYVSYKGCPTLTGITIPDSVTGIGNNAFIDCGSLASVTIPDSVTSIGDKAFADCNSLVSVVIGNGVTSIEIGAFYGCTSLASVTIGNSVTTIGKWAFLSCASLASVTIPDSVTGIRDMAFYYCTSLTSVTFEGTINSGNFSSVDPFPGDLRAKFYETDPNDGTPGTYTATNSVWVKQ